MILESSLFSDSVSRLVGVMVIAARSGGKMIGGQGTLKVQSMRIQFGQIH